MPHATVCLLSLALLGCGHAAETSGSASEGAADDRAEPDRLEPVEQAAVDEEPPSAAANAIDTTPFHGRWRNAEDPSGAIMADPVYEGATITFGADGSHAFTLGGGGSMGPLEGTWEVTGGEGDELRYRADYGGGRVTAETTLRLRRDGGEVVGLVVDEGAGAPQYYVPDTE
ncbi:MAG: hypothetical protein EVA89_36695 [Sandaracinaceae bacterium]|nr:MAG: hypothetical protein EVA89_36695 [Sandaracinaceae bacterium]